MVSKIYEELCKSHKIPFSLQESVMPYDSSTLFCPAGMQKFKTDFSNEKISGLTEANIQKCIRLGDLNLVGDGTHSICFNMIGLFSFRHWSLKKTVLFFHEFLKECSLVPDFVTMHEDKYKEWKDIHPKGTEIKIDNSCEWSDGEIGGYCTEFYINDIEVGNVVNPLGNCIDVGFGLERLQNLVDKTMPISRIDELKKACDALISSEIYPNGKGQGYILRKLLRMIDKEGGNYENKFFLQEKRYRQNCKEKYFKLLDKNKDKSDEWWWDTHGVDVKEILE